MLTLLRSPLGAAGAIAAGLAVKRRLAREATSLDLAGKVVLITGASTGLGLQMARECADQGAKLVICARTADRLHQAEEDLRQRGADVLAVVADVSQKAQVTALIRQAKERFGGIDVLMCNAGVIQVGAFESMRAEQFESSMNGMFFGTLYVIQEALPLIEQSQHGRIGIVSSIGGKVSVPHMLPYNAAKFALIGLGEGLRAELSPKGIPVTNIYPGLTRTGSYLNAEFTGDEAGKEKHYRLFSSLSSLPVLTGDGEVAAKVYVEAVKRGDAEVTYPPQYQLISRLHGVAPVLTTEVLGLGKRVMPQSGAPSGVSRGVDVQERMETGGVWKTLTALGRNAVQTMQVWRNVDR